MRALSLTYENALKKRTLATKFLYCWQFFGRHFLQHAPIFVTKHTAVLLVYILFFHVHFGATESAFVPTHYCVLFKMLEVVQQEEL